MRGRAASFLLISSVMCAQSAINQGVAAFKRGDYQQAIQFFQQEVAANPNEVNAHLYLGTAYMSQHVPGVPSIENDANARLAETEFKRVLQLDPNNATALASLASLAFKSHRLDEAMELYKRLQAADPTSKEAPYSMGVIAWSKWYPALMKAREAAGMKPQDPGPLPAPARAELKAQYSSVIDEGIANLDIALRLDPHYADAMAYMNLLIRERADLRDTKEEYAGEVAVADQWVQQSLAAKKLEQQSTGVAPPPPPPPPPAGQPSTPTRIRVGGNVQVANLVTKVEPVYPPLAQQAQISGQVRFTVIIGKDGLIQNVQLVSGHPLLVPAATNAVKQYVYKPTLLNGIPVEVITTVDVNFSLN